MSTNIEVFATEAEAISPGGKDAFGIKVDGSVVTWCIGSGPSMRDAKAAALRNAREVLRQIKATEVQ